MTERQIHYTLIAGLLLAISVCWIVGGFLGLGELPQ